MGNCSAAFAASSQHLIYHRGTSVVGGRWRKEAAETKCTLRKKIAQGSARGQCPVVFYEADGGRRAQQEGAAGGREERQQEAQEEAQAEAQVKKILIDPGKNL